MRAPAELNKPPELDVRVGQKARKLLAQPPINKSVNRLHFCTFRSSHRDGTQNIIPIQMCARSDRGYGCSLHLISDAVEVESIAAPSPVRSSRPAPPSSRSLPGPRGNISNDCGDELLPIESTVDERYAGLAHPRRNGSRSSTKTETKVMTSAERPRFSGRADGDEIA